VILGYPQNPTVRAGGRLVLRVSTDAPAFCVLVHRCGAEVEPVAVTGWLPGEAAPRGAPHEDWDWPGHVLEVPAAWRPGVYLAVLVEGDGGAVPAVGSPVPYAATGQVLFVVRAAEPRASILYKLPLFTWHAYNTAVPADGWSLYDLPGAGPREVSVRRPGGGTGGTPFDVFNRDPFDPTPRQTFLHWDAPFLAWLERSGYELDLCTDLDLHRDPDLLAHRPLLLSAGHDEYWSDAMRDHAEAHVAAGGNAAFLGGNTCWWRIEVDDGHAFRRAGNWWERGRPENHLTGVSFRNGGERHADHFPVPVGYRVQHADHWVFSGTGLRDGDVVGEREYVVGYEADGAHFDRARWTPARPAEPTGDDGTPAGFTILGVGDIAPSGWGNGNAAATMGLFTRGGTVFSGATVDWPRVVAGGTSPALERITHNVIRRLRRP
jgi:hypothetical protein